MTTSAAAKIETERFAEVDAYRTETTALVERTRRASQARLDAETLRHRLYRESVLRDELAAAEELSAISSECAARMRPVVEIEADLDTVRDQIDALAPIARAA